MKRSGLFFGLWIIAFALGLAAIRAVFSAPPAQIESGAMAQKIFYFHVGSAWTAFMAFLIAAGFGLGHLIAESASDSAGRRAAACFSAIEVGFLFCTVVLITGPIWARPVWGVWWRWEPRLTTFLILWATYASCLVVRASIDRAPLRDRVVSVYAIVAAVQIPVVYVSVHFWKPEAQFHPPTIGLAPEFLYPLWISMAAMMGLFFLLWRFRTQLCLLEERTIQDG